MYMIVVILQVEADVSGTPLDCEVKFPVVIGTIPAFQQTLRDPSQAHFMYPPPQMPPGEAGGPGYPPATGPGYPPATGPGYPPATAPPQQGYPPAAGPDQAMYPPPGAVQEKGEYPPPGQPGYPPADGMQPGPAPVGYPPAADEGKSIQYFKSALQKPRIMNFPPK